MKNNKQVLTMEQGMEAIMNILAEAGFKQEPIAPSSSQEETVYDGYGHVIAKNGKKTTTGYKKGAKRVLNSKDSLRRDLLDAAEVILNRVAAFEGKVGRNSVEGVIVRMADADYSVKCAGHAKPEFADREEGFVAEKNYITRGKAVNHAPAIAKVLVAEIENEFSKSNIGNGKSVTLLEAKSSGIRFEIKNENGVAAEYSYKITKKRARVVLG
mgnify:CR=1 FL=1